jgi:hypothetical protein
MGSWEGSISARFARNHLFILWANWTYNLELRTVETVVAIL